MSNHPLLVDVTTASRLLNSRLESPPLVVDVCQSSQYRRAHIPGALHVAPERTLSPPPRPGLLTDRGHRVALFRELGLRADRQVLVYDDEGGGWAGRFIWLLACSGFVNASLIDGGLHAWHAAGLPLTDAQSVVAEPGNFEPRDHADQHQIDLDTLWGSLSASRYQIWDARSPAEYAGVRATASRNGHIPGAILYEWTRVMDSQRHLQLRPLQDIRAELEALGIDGRKPVVTHCQSHHRSGLTWLTGRLLGWQMLAYAGSWSEWGNHPAVPIEQSD